MYQEQFFTQKFKCFHNARPKNRLYKDIPYIYEEIQNNNNNKGQMEQNKTEDVILLIMGQRPG